MCLCDTVVSQALSETLYSFDIMPPRNATILHGVAVLQKAGLGIWGGVQRLVSEQQYTVSVSIYIKLIEDYKSSDSAGETACNVLHN